MGNVRSEHFRSNLETTGARTELISTGTELMQVLLLVHPRAVIAPMASRADAGGLKDTSKQARSTLELKSSAQPAYCPSDGLNNSTGGF